MLLYLEILQTQLSFGFVEPAAFKGTAERYGASFGFVEMMTFICGFYSISFAMVRIL